MNFLINTMPVNLFPLTWLLPSGESPRTADADYRQPLHASRIPSYRVRLQERHRISVAKHPFCWYVTQCA